jgi:sterol desaturase/sphingolipid hydroxylase (fatty acid hydroxylase superfamily)
LLVLVIVFFVGLLACHGLERLFPIKEGYTGGHTRRGYFADIVATIVNGPALSGLTKLAFSVVVIYIPPTIRFASAWPTWVQFVVFLLINDFARYWLHRWYHTSNLLWRMHRVHHTITEMDALSVFRMHVGEAIIKNWVIFLPLRMIGFGETAIILYSSIDILKGFWHHANVRNYIGPLNYVINSAELHWWHHSTEARGQHSNYGSILSIWDWLFGTAYWPRGEWPETIGVEGMEAFPDDYVGQFASVMYDDDAAAAKYGEQAGGVTEPRRPPSLRCDDLPTSPPPRSSAPTSSLS